MNQDTDPYSGKRLRYSDDGFGGLQLNAARGDPTGRFSPIIDEHEESIVLVIFRWIFKLIFGG